MGPPAALSYNSGYIITFNKKGKQQENERVNNLPPASFDAAESICYPQYRSSNGIHGEPIGPRLGS
jgi:hypothetical protein